MRYENAYRFPWAEHKAANLIVRALMFLARRAKRRGDEHLVQHITTGVATINTGRCRQISEFDSRTGRWSYSDQCVLKGHLPSVR